MRNDEAIISTLRSLDPANRPIDINARASADLEAILAIDPATSHKHGAPHPAAAPSRPHHRRVHAKVVVVTGMVATVTAVLVVLPSVTAGDRAFATWTANPDGISGPHRAAAARSCRENHQDGAGSAALYVDDLANAETAIADERGSWTTVVLVGPNGFAAMCITDESAHLFASSMIGSIGSPTGYADPGPRDVIATDLGVGSMRAGDISLAGGAVGSQVRGVVYQSRAHGRVAATVNEGRFAFWFPGDELMSAPNDGVEVEVVLRDGTSISSRLSL